MKKPKRKQVWKKSQVCWAIQCDGGVGLINSTNASNRSDAIKLFMSDAGPERTWAFYRAPHGHYRAVRLETRVMGKR